MIRKFSTTPMAIPSVLEMVETDEPTPGEDEVSCDGQSGWTEPHRSENL